MNGGLHWNAEALRVRLAPLLPGLAVEVVGTTGSTNTDLLERVRAAPHRGFAPCLLVAEQQTGGRGRMGRLWHAEAGASLTFSLALELGAADWSGLSLAVGVALADALDPPAEDRAARIGLKWPNDLWRVDGPGRGRKLGGVLIESIPFGAQRIAVIGIGLNVRPVAARGDFASGYACIEELAATASAPAVLAAVAPALVEALRQFERTGFAPFHARYAARDLLFGQRVHTSGADATEGVAEGVAPDGALLLRTADGSVRTVSSGEVSVRLGAAPEPAGTPGGRAAAARPTQRRTAARRC